MSRRLCCCLECVVFQDDFDNAPGGWPDSNWSDEGGDWEYTGATLRETPGSAGALALCTVTTKTREQHVTCTLSGVIAGDKPRLIFNAVDADNLFYVQVEAGAGSTIVKLYKRLTGGDSLLVTKTVADLVSIGELSFSICCSDTSATFWSISVDGGAANVFVFECDPELFSNGTKAGLGNGTTNAIDFTFFGLENFWGHDGEEPDDYQCCRQQCLCEEGGTEYCIPDTLTLTLFAPGPGNGCTIDLHGQTVTLTFNNQNNTWESTDPATSPPCLFNGQWLFRCHSSENEECEFTGEEQFSLTITGPDGADCMADSCLATAALGASSVSCSPLSIVFPVTNYEWAGPPTPPLVCDCCAGGEGLGWYWGVVTA